ncbi:MAG TPA: hypothetical protein VLB82_15120 [Thermodesulfobacteriota bacterium]|nr:hypothetical protein [Thermodesulfobacteriota bacterium]
MPYKNMREAVSHISIFDTKQADFKPIFTNMIIISGNAVQHYIK